MSKPLVVAIDGPSGTGKSSVSKAVAKQLGLAYLDTGAMYRALAWSCLDVAIDFDDGSAVAEHSRTFDLRMGMDPAAPTVAVGTRRIDREIREDAVTSVVSRVATNLDVRADMLTRQRALIAEGVQHSGGVVAEGRDITTVVAPDADVRILMTASEEARMARRSRQLRVSAESTRSQIIDRDRTDSTVSQFTTAADGVVTVDTSHIDFRQSVAAVLHVVKEAVGGDVDLSTPAG
ncbi:(d)CMP kinase [Flexivirga sp. ID2601S]|uniref:Cytidylate kinase n=1 Tax=Flexivirga aerilata TaxID=1656889 RepID=A0A849AL88_9MICO|nr:(d)CMP kinase [Flexivirga aerilata]NNG40833.1 (d)CMP kinase [Flexivirga aerilata]